jgi:hypothetical protein
MSSHKQAVIRRHTHIGELPDGRRVTMVWTEYRDHILTQTADYLGPEASEWFGSILEQYDEEDFGLRCGQKMKPIVCIGACGVPCLFEGGCHFGRLAMKEAKILSRYNGIDPAKILKDHNKEVGL